MEALPGRREVETRFTARTVEIFLGGERIAVHAWQRKWPAYDGARAYALEPPAPSGMDAGEDPR